MTSSSVGTTSGASPSDGTAEPLSVLLRRCADDRGDEPAVTYLDHSRVREGVAATLTWRELDDRVDSVAEALFPGATEGDRVAVMCPQSLDYLVAFLAAVRARLIAVPLFPPGDPRQWPRLSAVLADCAPRLLLTTRGELDGVRKFAESEELAECPVVAVDTLPPATDRLPEPTGAGPDDVAYLQYTSGSTRTPAGVMVTHRNVVANSRQAVDAFGMRAGDTVNVSWLPLFHDMGLVLGLASTVVSGTRSVLMDPDAFLSDPARWLRALSANPGAITAAPSFAYSYAAGRVGEHERTLLNLEHVAVLIDGSEPVLPGNIARFHEAFAECGLRRRAHRPSYGLAEATVLVSATPPDTEPRITRVDRDALAAGRAVRATGRDAVSELVSCGLPVDQRVRITDPDTADEVPDTHVGEVWVSGANVGLGYWGRPDETAATFVDHDGTRWLRTGDLGVLVYGHLHITGRLKDLVIADGRNHYPQDIEVTVERAHPGVRRHTVAAFGVPFDDGERLVLLAERARDLDRDSHPDADVVAAVRAAVSAEHGLNLHDLVLLDPGRVPRTSSGKISRSACRAEYLRGVS